MKRCPTCNRTFTENNLSFCLDDGTPLAIVPNDDEPTRVTPQSGAQPQGSWSPPAYQAPQPYQPPGSKGQQRSSWPWVLGILAVVLIAIVGFGVAAAIMIPRLVRNSGTRENPIIVTTPNENSANTNSNLNSNSNLNLNSNLGANKNDNLNGNINSNLNSNSNANANSNSDAGSLPPTDNDKVLADLTDLENEWTVANINADKKALQRILADDYVGTSNGKSQGKAEYLRTIERDRTISHWEFDDLKLELLGDRASLSGVITLTISGTDRKLQFTDKFVWRDNRWQATGSEVTAIQ
jgi:hypothetical protein